MFIIRLGVEIKAEFSLFFKIGVFRSCECKEALKHDFGKMLAKTSQQDSTSPYHRSY